MFGCDYFAGDLYFEKAVNGFLADLFTKWKVNSCSSSSCSEIRCQCHLHESIELPFWGRPTLCQAALRFTKAWDMAPGHEKSGYCRSAGKLCVQVAPVLLCCICCGCHAVGWFGWQVWLALSCYMCDAGATQVCFAQSLFQGLVPNGSLALCNPVVLLVCRLGPLVVCELLEAVLSETNKASLSFCSRTTKSHLLFQCTPWLTARCSCCWQPCIRGEGRIGGWNPFSHAAMEKAWGSRFLWTWISEL